MSKKDFIVKAVEGYADAAIRISDGLWDDPEVAYTEYRACAALTEELERQGFEVETGAAGIPTAFVARWGSGHPAVGIIIEYDALQALNQKADVFEKCETAHGQPGHGCGHHLIGGGSIAGAVAVKKYMEAHGTKGTIICYGCPAEEGGSGKTFMAREGVFDGCDIAVRYHPGDMNTVVRGSTLANVKIKYSFDGRAAHAAGDPEKGRSALDAVELMNLGVQFLREHIIQEARIHYAIIDHGGEAPNVVQAHAEVMYMIRAPRLDQVLDIYRRVNLIANGAAMMTETECKVTFIKGCSDLLNNSAVGRRYYENMKLLGVPEYTAEEIEYAARMNDTVGNTGPKEGEIAAARKCAEDMPAAEAEALMASFGKPISDVVMPFMVSDAPSAGSSDVADVSLVCPCTFFLTVSWSQGTPGHSWQTVAQGKSSIAHKGMLYGAEVLALTAIDFMEDPALVEAAWAEHRSAMGGRTYECPIPKEIKPPIPERE